MNITMRPKRRCCPITQYHVSAPEVVCTTCAAAITHDKAFATRLTQRLITLALLLILQGCAAWWSKPAPPTPLTNMQANQQLQHWQLRGKIGLRQRSSAYSAYLNWQQCGDRYDIRLTGPFGQGAARLYGDRNGATLNRGDDTSISANNPEHLLTQALGWPIPVSQLIYWVRGIPQPDDSYVESDTHTGFTQANWQLSYPKLQPVERYYLPSKAIAKQAGLTVTVLLKHWDLNPVCDLTL